MRPSLGLVVILMPLLLAGCTEEPQQPEYYVLGTNYMDVPVNMTIKFGIHSAPDDWVVLCTLDLPASPYGDSVEGLSAAIEADYHNSTRICGIGMTQAEISGDTGEPSLWAVAHYNGTQIDGEPIRTDSILVGGDHGEPPSGSYVRVTSAGQIEDDPVGHPWEVAVSNVPEE